MEWWSKLTGPRNAKAAFRELLRRNNLELVRNPPGARLARLAVALDIETVLDVGANFGQFAHDFRRNGYTGRLVSLEPLALAYEELLQRSASDPTWLARRTAVGREIGQMVIHRSANSYSSSMLPMTRLLAEAAPQAKFVGSETVPVTTVSALASDFNVDPWRCLLKIDTQGFESFVLDGAGDLLEKFRLLKIELSTVELYEGQVLAVQMMERLETSGFTLCGVEHGFTDEKSGLMLQFDGLFYRRHEARAK